MTGRIWFLVVALASTQLLESRPSTGLSREDGLRLMRAVVATEAEVGREQRPFLDLRAVLLDDVFALPAFAELQAAAGKSSSVTTVLLDGYTLALLTSADGQEYNVALRNTARCGPSWFSSHDGIIYEGRPIGCY